MTIFPVTIEKNVNLAQETMESLLRLVMKES
jgi:hypothetical protein